MRGWALSMVGATRYGDRHTALDGQRTLDERGLDYLRDRVGVRRAYWRRDSLLLTCGRGARDGRWRRRFHPGEPGDGFFIVIEASSTTYREREGSGSRSVPSPWANSWAMSPDDRPVRAPVSAARAWPDHRAPEITVDLSTSFTPSTPRFRHPDAQPAATWRARFARWQAEAHRGPVASAVRLSAATAVLRRWGAARFRAVCVNVRFVTHFDDRGPYSIVNRQRGSCACGRLHGRTGSIRRAAAIRRQGGGVRQPMRRERGCLQADSGGTPWRKTS